MIRAFGQNELCDAMPVFGMKNGMASVTFFHLCVVDICCLALTCSLS